MIEKQALGRIILLTQINVGSETVMPRDCQDSQIERSVSYVM